MANMYMNGQTSLHLGADVAMNFTEREPMHAIFDKTVGRGVGVALDALGTPETFESCLRVIRPVAA